MTVYKGPESGDAADAGGAGGAVGDSVFRDDFYGASFDPHIWALSGGGAYVLPGGTQHPGGQGRMTKAVAGIPGAKLLSEAGLCDVSPRFEARVKLGGDGNLTNMVAFIGMIDDAFNDAAYWQYSASVGANWLAVTGSDATIVDTGIPVVADTFYTLSIEEFADRVEFGIVQDATGTLKPVVVASLTTNRPTAGVRDRRLHIALLPTENVIKSFDFDWVEVRTGRGA